MTRYHLQAAATALTLGCAVAASSSSSAPATTSGILRGGGEQGEMDDLNNENFKENEDWWKDPFAMFDEDEEDNGGGVMEGDDLEMMEELPELTEEEASPQVNEDEFLIIEEPEPEPEPVEPEPVEPVQEEEEAPAAASKGWGGWASRGNNNKAEAASEEDASPEHNPLVEQAMVTSQRASLADNPKLQTMWKALPFFNSLLASFAFIKVVQPVIEQATERHQSNIFSKNSQQYYDDNDHDHQYSRSHDSRRNSNNDDEHQLDDDDDDRSSLQQKQQQRAAPKKEKSFGFGGGMFGGRKPKKYVEKLPPARELMELVEALQREVDTLKVEKEAVDAEYEKTSWTLQETQNEMANLQSTTQYLKAQLRDNAEIMDRAVRAERRKARDELTKMKEAMLQVLQRERAELRAKMLKQTQEVQAILKEQQSSSSSSKNNNTGDQLMTTTG